MAQLLFALVRLRSQHVAQMRMPALYFSAGSFLKALGGAFMCFQLWHKSSRSASSTWQLALATNWIGQMRITFFLYAFFLYACPTLFCAGGATCGFCPVSFFGAKMACSVLPS